MMPRPLKYHCKHAVRWYNEPDKRVITLTYHLVRLRLCHETQSEKLKNYIFWRIYWHKNRWTEILTDFHAGFRFKNIFSWCHQSLCIRSKNLSFAYVFVIIRYEIFKCFFGRYLGFALLVAGWHWMASAERMLPWTLKKKMTTTQFKVKRENGTEPAFNHE